MATTTYTCNVPGCGQVFSTLEELKTHMATTHATQEQEITEGEEKEEAT